MSWLSLPAFYRKSLNVVTHMFLFAVTPIAKVDDVEGLAVAATKHLELLKQKDKAEGRSIIERIVGKLLQIMIEDWQPRQKGP